jgi:ferric-dicitrate binding protein FerR (iron transport regulator)
MAKTDTAKSAVPYIRRLLEDEYVQEQLRDAAGGLRAVYERASRERGKAAEDKHVYGNLRHAATSIRNAATALQQPKPKPRRRFLKIATLAFAVGGSAGLVIWLQKQQPVPSQPSDPGTGAGTPAAEADGSQQFAEPQQAATGTVPPA